MITLTKNQRIANEASLSEKKIGCARFYDTAHKKGLFVTGKYQVCWVCRGSKRSKCEVLPVSRKVYEEYPEWLNIPDGWALQDGWLIALKGRIVYKPSCSNFRVVRIN